jgi:carbonic anhydrase/acetyltransferase-like protein (isoleucine patch superfamily)
MTEPRAGRVRLAPTAFVAPGARVLGEVTIGPRASVWFNTVVRGDVDTITLGEASNLQDNSTVHVDAGQPVRIGARVTVGHRTIIHGCVIEDDCLIGMGSVLLSGCRIGAGSYIGASSLVLEGMEIPPGSVALGSPARVTGPVGDRHRAGIQHGAETYAELAQACMRRGMARHVDRTGEVVHDAPAMTWGEWRRCLEVLAELPARLELAASAGASSDPRTALWLDAASQADRERRPVLASLMRHLSATVWEPAPPAKAEKSRDLREAIESWKKERAALVFALVPLGEKDWLRLAGHARRGPFTLVELVREWLDEDLERLAALSRLSEIVP